MNLYPIVKQPTIQVYKIAKGWAIFIYLFGPLMIALFCWLLTLPFHDKDIPSSAGWIIIPVCLAMIILMTIGLIDTYKARLVIDENKISSKSTLSNRELEFKEIKGYSVNEQYIFIEPIDKKKKRIKISKYTGGYDDILFWLSENFPDLDQQNLVEEEQNILRDEKFGLTSEMREQALAKARQRAKVINWTAAIVAVWAFFYPEPYQYSIMAAMAMPIVALLAVKYSNGLIRVDEKKGTAYPSLSLAFLFPSLAVALRAVSDYEIFNYSKVWLPTIIMTATFLFLVLIKQQEISFKKRLDYVTILSLALFFFAYSFGAVVHVNCYYDESEPDHFTAKVLDKRVSSGRSTTYYLKLSSWGQQKEASETSVDKGLYNRTNIDDDVSIYFGKGKLEIPWFEVTDKQK